jgi:molybdopterin/thiamine biosynthesis adenylyltransferase
MSPLESVHEDRPEPQLARYSRQMLFEAIGQPGQKRLQHAQVTLIGCGALGSVLANTLVRGGIGCLRIVDRDFIELENLHRQFLFDEHDIAHNLPKAEAAARKLRKINSAVEVDPLVADANPGNIESFCTDVELILDGTDNFETRFLINDVAVKHNVPWVYGACIAAEGLVMPILPHQTPCLRCIWEQAPPPGSTPTCDTAGVLASVASITASLQAVEAIKILTGRLDEVNRKLLAIDAWRGTIHAIDVQSAYEAGDCRCCKRGEYEFLAGQHGSQTTTLCGREAVQVLPPPGTKVNFKQVAARLARHARATFNQYMLKFAVDDYHVTLFPNGRAIIQGTADEATAKSVYARYIGA